MTYKITITKRIPADEQIKYLSEHTLYLQEFEELDIEDVVIFLNSNKEQTEGIKNWLKWTEQKTKVIE